MDLAAYISFGDELVKLALDAGTRANLADREQKEYLEGGELPSNTPQEVYADPKLASISKKLKKKYEKIHIPLKEMLGGAIAGGVLANIVTGGKAKGIKLRAPAGAGAGVGLADYLLLKKPKKKVAMLGSNTFSPGRSLSQSRAVGGFQDKIIHKGDRLRPPTMGQKFIIPSTPGE